MGEVDEGSSGRSGALQVFRVPQFSLYFFGQLFSNTGLWFQNLTISLIVIQLTASAGVLSLVTVAQFGPLLFLAGLAGKVADRFSPRTVLLVSSVVAMAATGGLAWELAQDEVSLTFLLLLLAAGGCVAAFERVAAQAFVFELVGPSLLKNAVVLSTVYISAARSIGPGLAGVAYLTLGPVSCLLINAVSYLFVFVSLLCIRPANLHARRADAEQKVSFAQVIKEVRGNKDLVVILLVNSIATFAAMNMNVVLTTAVTIDFGGDAGQLGVLHGLNAVGAVIGGYLLTRVESIAAATLGPAMLVFAATLALSAGSPNLVWFMCAAPLLGLGIGLFQGVIQSAAQLASPPEMIGRTMSLVTMGNYGIAPFGAVAIGLLIDVTSARTALGVGAFVAGCLSLTVYLLYRSDTRTAPQ